MTALWNNTPGGRSTASALMLAAALACGLWRAGEAPVGAQDDAPDSEQEQPGEPADPPLPKLEDLELPSAAELLETRIDWIVLKDGGVLRTRPVFPRPRTLEKIEDRIEALGKSRRLKKEERKELRKIEVTLPGDEEGALYELSTTNVEKIVYHEDLVLQRVGQLVDEGELTRAFELLFPTARRHPDWPGLAAHQKRLLLEQGRERLRKGRNEDALVYLEELHDLAPRHEGLEQELVRAADRLVEAAVDDGDFRRARFFLARLRARFPDSDATTGWSAKLHERADRLLSRARTASSNARHDRAAALAAQAAGVWPDTEGLQEFHRRVTRRWQRLRVGVVSLANDDTAFPVPTSAARRRGSLTRTRLFTTATFDRSARYRTTVFDSWEPTELGREITFQLRPDREPWESRSVVTAGQVSRALRSRLDTEDDRYDPRLAALVDGLSVESPFRLRLNFRRVPLRPEPLLAVPLPPRNGAPSGRFLVHEKTPDRVVYRRTHPEPDDLPAHHIAEIALQKFPNDDDAAQALLRGEIDALERVAPRHVDQLARDERFLVHRQALPRTHLLQFDPDHELLQNRSLRRALATAIDRDAILQDVLLRERGRAHGRAVSGPFPSSSPFANDLVEPRTFDLSLAITLRLAAEKELKQELPELRLLCEPDPAVQAAAEAIVSQWKRAGLPARIVEPTDSGGDWDVLYRTVSIAEPATQAWPLLTLGETAQVERLRPLPDWLRHDLTELERTIDWKSAVARTQDLHARLHDDARLIALWEVDQFFAVARTVRNVGAAGIRPVRPWDDVERWIVRPSYPEPIRLATGD